MFDDLDCPPNASRGLSAIAEFLDLNILTRSWSLETPCFQNLWFSANGLTCLPN